MRIASSVFNCPRSLFGLLLLAFLCVSCGDKSNYLTRYPAWVSNPYHNIKEDLKVLKKSGLLKGDDEVKVAGVGSAAPTGDIASQMDIAQMVARVEIASQIMVAISRASESNLTLANKKRKDQFGDDSEKSGVPEVIERHFRQSVSESIESLPVVGARRINTWQDQDGTLFVRMALAGEEAGKYMKDVLNKALERHFAKFPKDNIKEKLDVKGLEADLEAGFKKGDFASPVLPLGA